MNFFRLATIVSREITFKQTILTNIMNHEN